MVIRKLAHKAFVSELTYDHWTWQSGKEGECDETFSPPLPPLTVANLAGHSRLLIVATLAGPSFVLTVTTLIHCHLPIEICKQIFNSRIYQRIWSNISFLRHCGEIMFLVIMNFLVYFLRYSYTTEEILKAANILEFKQTLKIILSLWWYILNTSSTWKPKTQLLSKPMHV